MLLGNELTFPTLTAGDAGYTFFHTANKLPYTWDGTSWIGLGTGNTTVWRKTDLITSADSYTEQIHHNGNVVLNGVSRDAAYANAMSSCYFTGTIGIAGSGTVQTENITSWLKLRGNQGVRIEQINQNVGHIQIGNMSLGTMSGNQTSDPNVSMGRSFTASASQTSDPNWRNLQLDSNVNYTAATAGTTTFNSIYIAPSLTNVDVHYGLYGSGWMRYTTYGSGTVTGTRAYKAAFASDGLLIEESLNPVVTGFRQESAAYTIDTDDHIIELTSNTFTVTLPTAVGITGQQFIIKNSGSGTITLDGDGAETIDGAASVNLAQYDYITVVSNGTDFITISTSL